MVKLNPTRLQTAQREKTLPSCEDVFANVTSCTLQAILTELDNLPQEAQMTADPKNEVVVAFISVSAFPHR